ncbi:MAG: NAD(P)-binding domain-containing protein [Hyphomicrobiales bacterium]|nr:NAD(P)-binding domain-containing protein [Hyphomicrobiales bacterium]MDE2115593.1 NAD(P)-binding domain-containing protein [Hyphomicrobiales bacterium]
MGNVDTVIIGAGPYGLSLSAHLSAAGVGHYLIGSPMQAWAEHAPPGMNMRSEAFATDICAPQKGLRLRDYCAAHGIDYAPVGMVLPREIFIAYGRWFADQLPNASTHRLTSEVDEIAGHEAGYITRLADGRTLLSKRVVLATGLMGHQRLPQNLAHLPKPNLLHGADFGPIDWVKGKDVLVVGGGQSALGLAALLAEQGTQVRVLVREPHVVWNGAPEIVRPWWHAILHPRAGLGTGWRAYILSEWPLLFWLLPENLRRRSLRNSWGPSGAWDLKARIDGKVPLELGTSITDARLEGAKVCVTVHGPQGSRVLHCDHLIAATGYRVDMAGHPLLAQNLRDGLGLQAGEAPLTLHFETRLKGLYLLGPASAFSFGHAMRHICGTKVAVPTLCRHIQRQSRRRPHAARPRPWPWAPSLPLQ